MQNSQLPTKWVVPFAAGDGAKVELPVTTAAPGRASLNLGFPPLTMQPLEVGGLPPQGEDFNGAMNQVARFVWWAMAGGAIPFDGTWAADSHITGYPQGAEIASSDLLGSWLSLVENNVINPDTVGTGWAPGYVYGVTTVSGLTGGTTTLTPLQAAKSRIVFTGTLTSNAIIIVPNWLKDWVLVNNTTGAFTLTVKTVAGSGVSIPQNGAPTAVNGDGTNITQVAENIAAATQLTQPVRLGQFSAQLASNGWVTLPNGIMIQWGLTPSIAPSSTGTIALPVTFPNNFWQVVACFTDTITPGRAFSTNASPDTVTRSQFTLRNPDASGTSQFRWFAVGN